MWLDVTILSNAAVQRVRQSFGHVLRAEPVLSPDRILTAWLNLHHFLSASLTVCSDLWPKIFFFFVFTDTRWPSTTSTSALWTTGTALTQTHKHTYRVHFKDHSIGQQFNVASKHQRDTSCISTSGTFPKRRGNFFQIVSCAVTRGHFHRDRFLTVD